MFTDNTTVLDMMKQIERMYGSSQWGKTTVKVKCHGDIGAAEGKIMSEFKVGDQVEKVGGDYQFKGTVVSVFKKLSEKIRYVVEDDRGVLHVYSAKNLKLDVKAQQRQACDELAAQAQDLNMGY